MQQTKSLTEQMRELLEKNLPAQLGDVLRKRLADLEVLEGHHKQLQEENESNKEIILNLNKVSKKFRDEHSAIKELEAGLIVKEQILKAKQIELDKKELECNLRIEHCNILVNTVKEMYKIPFQNRILREDCLIPMKIKGSRLQSVYKQNIGNEDVVVEEEYIETRNSEKEIEEK